MSLGSLVSESRIHNGSTLAFLGAVVLTPFDPLSNVFPPWIYSFYSFAAAAIKLGSTMAAADLIF